MLSPFTGQKQGEKNEKEKKGGGGGGGGGTKYEEKNVLYSRKKGWNGTVVDHRDSMAYSYEPLNGYNGARPIEIKIEGPSGNAKVISSPCHRARANRYSGISRTALNLVGQLAQPFLSNPHSFSPYFYRATFFSSSSSPLLPCPFLSFFFFF